MDVYALGSAHGAGTLYGISPVFEGRGRVNAFVQQAQGLYSPCLFSIVISYRVTLDVLSALLVLGCSKAMATCTKLGPGKND